MQLGNSFPYLFKFYATISINSRVTNFNNFFPPKYCIRRILTIIYNQPVHCSNKPNILPIFFIRIYPQLYYSTTVYANTVGYVRVESIEKRKKRIFLLQVFNIFLVQSSKKSVSYFLYCQDKLLQTIYS